MSEPLRSTLRCAGSHALVVWCRVLLNKPDRDVAPWCLRVGRYVLQMSPVLEDGAMGLISFDKVPFDQIVLLRLLLLLLLLFLFSSSPPSSSSSSSFGTL